MGLTVSSTGSAAADTRLFIRKRSEDDMVVALAGNPNVGKSTLFNALTGMKQHTGNWPGKTVTNAQGYCVTDKNSFVLVDIPGTYSLSAHSPEEEVARNFICFGQSQITVVVCDGTCLERNLNLVLQILEVTENVIVCVNLLDEAKRKGITVDTDGLSEKLGVPVVGTVARNKKSLSAFLKELDKGAEGSPKRVYSVQYPKVIENAVKQIEPVIKNITDGKLSSRWLSLKLLEGDKVFLAECEGFLGKEILGCRDIEEAVKSARQQLTDSGITDRILDEMIASSAVLAAEELCRDTVKRTAAGYSDSDRRADKILTGKRFGYLVMILLLCLVFWITVFGANYISEALARVFSYIENILNGFLIKIDTPETLRSILIDGIYRVPAWIVSVMLPPMAVFFPLFTLLEDSGYLPRVAYNLDKPFKRCHSCGKQALTMCMGLGCNAAGVVGGRIIDSPRERLLAIITNSLVPCNGRFPAIIALISMFFVCSSGFKATVVSALALTAVILFGILMTFFSTALLSKTLLKGERSSYTLEMPPYRKPQIGSVIVRSIFDRTLFVLGRAVTVAVPAGIIIWLLANITVGDITLLAHCAELLDPFARIMGLDGVILLAFILGFPANEIVLPIIIMAYLSQGSISELSSLTEIRQILTDNGWTNVTALCTIVFSLLHWPCSTTVLTVKKETGSIKWTLLSVLYPTALGMIVCMLINFTARLI